MLDTHLLWRLTEQARRYPDRLALQILKDGAGGHAAFTWCEVLRLAQQGLDALRCRGLSTGDRVLLALPTSEAFVAGLLGALWGGIVPATLALPSNRHASVAFAAEWRSLVALLAPAAIITEMALPQVDVPRISPEELLQSRATQAEVEDCAAPDRIAYIQFTSGSTGRPRGVVLSLAGMCANLESMRWRLRLTPEDCMVSWLPMYHDMGLFGGLLLPLYCGARTMLMDPSFFVANPLLWFKMMAETRATISPVPPSALHVGLQLLRRRPQPQLALSSCLQFIVGAEPVLPHLIQHFNEVLTPYGVAETALRPAYGLAEATLAVTMPFLGQAPRIDWVQREALEVHRHAVPTTAETQGSQGWVSVGRPLEGVRLSIVAETGEPVPERHVGRILLQSSSLMTAVLENGTLYPPKEAWLDTGDLGYLADGELFVTGRWKDIIIKRGRNYSPERLEELAALVEGVHRVTAFGLYDETALTEKVVLLVEPRSKYRNSAQQRDHVRLAVRSQLRLAGYEVDEVHLIPKGQLPRTTSGKIRRQHCRELFVQHAFEKGNSL